MRAIAGFLDQLDRELRLRRTPRSRLLAEAGDHLRAAADELAAAGAEPAAAEAEAVARFGAASLVARRFAQAVATTAARTAVVWAATAWATYAVAAVVFILTAPSWLNDFPQGAPSMLGLQVAAVALVVTAVRAWRVRGEPLVDEERLRFVGNGVVATTAVIALAAGAELFFALTRPAPAPWGAATTIVTVYTVAALAAAVAGLVAVAAAARASVLVALPRPQGELTPAVALLVDDLAAAAPRLRPLAFWLTSRPMLVCGATAALAFAAIVAVAVADDAGLAGAAATATAEALAVVFAYLTLGRALGLRPPRRGVAS